MIPIESCYRYTGIITKLTKTNSFIHNGRVIYIAKKDHEGKPYGLYIAYDYKTKIQLAFGKTKDFVIEFIKKQDLKVLDELD